MENKYKKLLTEDAKRHNRRIKLHHPARFSIDENKMDWAPCTIININKNLDGIGIEFHDQKDVKVGSIVILDLLVPGELMPICCKGILRWINQKENGYVGGIKLIEKNDNVRKLIEKSLF
jgi:hypothetical protein